MYGPMYGELVNCTGHTCIHVHVATIIMGIGGYSSDTVATYGRVAPL